MIFSLSTMDTMKYTTLHMQKRKTAKAWKWGEKFEKGKEKDKD